MQTRQRLRNDLAWSLVVFTIEPNNYPENRISYILQIRYHMVAGLLWNEIYLKRCIVCITGKWGFPETEGRIDWIQTQPLQDITRSRLHVNKMLKIFTTTKSLKTLRPCNAYMHQWTGSSMVHVMACSLFDANRNLIQCYFIANWALWNKIQSNFHQKFSFGFKLVATKTWIVLLKL